MRRLLTFDCEGAELAATVDSAGGGDGLLLVIGGSQTRIGSHRMYERLAAALAERGIACFRFDRRGVGDSEGEDPGFRGSGPDLAAAAVAFRAACPGLARIFGFGLCDGATALAFHGDRAGLAGLILVNPWLVETVADQPAPAAIRRHYRKRLLSREGWKKILSGQIDYRKLLKGIGRIAKPIESAPLAAEAAAGLARHRLPARLILAAGDATAIAAEHEMKSRIFSGLGEEARKLDTDSHTFARPGDEALLLEATLEALGRLGAQAV